MTAHSIIPAHIISLFIWNLLDSELPDIWDKANYDGLMPIMPGNEEPEFAEYDSPRIVYAYSNEPTGYLAEHGRAIFAMTIYDKSIRNLTTTSSLLTKAMGRHDETAKMLNKFSSLYQVNGVRPFEGISFGTVSAVVSEGIEPSESEGGKHSSLLVLTHDYFYEDDGIDYSFLDNM